MSDKIKQAFDQGLEHITVSETLKQEVRLAIRPRKKWRNYRRIYLQALSMASSFIVIIIIGFFLILDKNKTPEGDKFTNVPKPEEVWIPKTPNPGDLIVKEGFFDWIPSGKPTTEDFSTSPGQHQDESSDEEGGRE